MRFLFRVDKSLVVGGVSRGRLGNIVSPRTKAIFPFLVYTAASAQDLASRQERHKSGHRNRGVRSVLIVFVAAKTVSPRVSVCFQDVNPDAAVHQIIIGNIN